MGTDAYDEFTILRRRLADIEREAYRRQHDSLGQNSRTLVGRVFDGGSMPTTVPGFVKVRPGTVDGDEAIGSAVTLAEDAWDEAVVLVLGPLAPAVGELLVAELIDGYWVAGLGSAAGGCTMQLEFYYADEFTNVNGSGEAAIHVTPAIDGVSDFLVVPIHQLDAETDRWALIIPSIHVEDGEYTFTMSQTGVGTQTFVKTIADCTSNPPAPCLCSGLPETVDLTVVVPDPNGFLRDCTLTYGMMPANFLALGAGPFWRSEVFENPAFGPPTYILLLRCLTSALMGTTQPHLWYLRTIIGPSASGNPVYAWDDEASENTCSPVSWTSGFPVGSATTEAIITG